MCLPGFQSNCPTVGRHRQSPTEHVLLTLDNLVVDSLLHSEDDIKLVVAALKAFRGGLDPPVPIQHVQDAILRVPTVAHRQGSYTAGGGFQNAVTYFLG